MKSKPKNLQNEDNYDLSFFHILLLPFLEFVYELTLYRWNSHEVTYFNFFVIKKPSSKAIDVSVFQNNLRFWIIFSLLVHCVASFFYLSLIYGICNLSKVPNLWHLAPRIVWYQVSVLWTMNMQYKICDTNLHKISKEIVKIR